ncbi:hypothetical protein CMUST_14935 [Corynebacterium mustelae]|uniref:Uncharacterized protein n=1 Tax=Corynebacterium mustelae TaxID=571915 RepID=A0A0G3H1J1_9CORY|nr:hypothetical protein CMUST_14935 [Corynebacterium mustelae]
MAIIGYRRFSLTVAIVNYTRDRTSAQLKDMCMRRTFPPWLAACLTVGDIIFHDISIFGFDIVCVRVRGCGLFD